MRPDSLVAAVGRGRPDGGKNNDFVLLREAAFEPSPAHGARSEGEGMSTKCVERG
jgi:hypothetical protein